MTMQQTLTELRAIEAEVTMELDAELGLTATAKSVSTLDDLELLLTESLALRNERGAGKSLREQLNRAKTKEEAREIELTLQAWESRHVWETLANCALFHKQVCACGAEHTHFAGMYYHQKHRQDPHSQRWVAAVQNLTGVVEFATLASVPNRTMVEARHTPICPECASRSGFDITRAEEPWK